MSGFKVCERFDRITEADIEPTALGMLFRLVCHGVDNCLALEEMIFTCCKGAGLIRVFEDLGRQ